MPFALVTIGLLMIVVGAKGTQKEFGQELVSDFTGSGNFTYWIASLGAVGALGYIDSFKTFSRVFMGLIILSMVISNRGVFAKLSEALNSGPEKITKKESDAANSNTPGVGELGNAAAKLGAQSNSSVQNIMAEGTKRVDDAGKRASNIISMAFKAYGM